MQSIGLNLGDGSGGPLIARKHQEDDAEFDITAMVDLVFLMNLYFLVAFLTAALAEVDLPSASHVAPLDIETAVVFTVLDSLNDEDVTMYVGNGRGGEPISDAAEQEKLVRAAVESGIAEGKTAVLIKAESHVCLRELFRIMTAATADEVKLHVAVLELDESS